MNTMTSNAERRFLALAATGLLALFECTFSAAAQLPTAPPATVYKLQPAKQVLARFEPLKILIGLNKEAKLLPAVQRGLGNVKFAYQEDDPTNFLSLDLRNGALAFSKSIKRYDGDFAPQLPDVSVAQEIADQFLTAQNLMPTSSASDKIVLAAVQTVAAARPRVKGLEINSDNQAVNFDKFRVVTYRREINGMPVVGPGSKIVVTIGDQNEVVSVIKRWSAFTPPKATTMMASAATTQNDAVITPAVALSRMQERIVAGFGLGQSNPQIVSADTALYDSNDKAIQPVYVFQVAFGQRQTVSGQAGPGFDSQDRFMALIPALSKTPEPIYQLGDAPNSRIPLPKLGDDEVQ